jgi:hypothetical protein
MQHTKPCAKCPFKRTTESGYLGGSPVYRFIGQIYGPFWLPCHATDSYKHDKFDTQNLQCAGAGIFRGNVNAGEQFSDRVMASLLILPPDTETVFGSYEEFFMHHTGCDLETAKAFLSENNPRLLAFMEFDRQSVQEMELK